MVGRFLNADSVVPNVGGNIKGYNVFIYCVNNPVNMVDSSGHYPNKMTEKLKMYQKAQKESKKTSDSNESSYVTRSHITTPTYMFDAGPAFGKIGFSITTTSDEDDHDWMYAYIDSGNDETRCGSEITAGDWLAIGSGVSSNINYYINMQISPVFHLEGSIGLDGIGFTAGIDANNIAYDLEIKAGWGIIFLFYTGQYITAGGAIVSEAMVSG